MEFALVALWALAALVLGAYGLPVAAAVFPRAADRGAGLALPLVLAVLGFVGYWVGRVAFGWPALLAGLGVLFVGAVVALRRGAWPAWRRAAEVGVVFLVAFGLLVAVRAVDPGAIPGGGEKFLDFGLLASLYRTETLPPADHWFAGKPVAYYYGGHMVMALLGRLTGTDPAHAYNLALALTYGTYVSAAYGLAGAMAAARDRSYTAAGVAAALLVGVASNLATPLRLLGWLLPEPAGRHLVTRFGLQFSRTLAQGPDLFGYWGASRVIPWTINEFPLFAFLNGDLHGHMMSPPFLLLAAGLLFAYYRTPATEVWRRRALVFGALPPLAGLVAVVNTWSLPTVGGLAWLALALAPTAPWTLLPARWADRVAATLDDRGRAAREVARPVVALVAAGAVLVLGVVLVAPFVFGTASGRAVAFLPPADMRSGLGGLLVVHGAFLAVSVAYLAERAPLSREGWLTVALVVALGFAVAFPLSIPAFALFGPLFFGAWALRRRERVGFEGVLLVAVTGLLMLVEVAYVDDHSVVRFNTVFKTYAQVWALWGVAGGVMLADAGRLGAVAGALRARLRGAAPSAGRRDALRAAVAVLLLCSLSVYGAFALHAHFTDQWQSPSLDDPTLDARHYVSESHPDEYAAIEWLADRPGQPTIVAAPGRDIYRWVNAPSSLTGLPTVAGWSHERGYRGVAAYERRASDVDRLFTGDAGTRALLLERYDVTYIYVGPVERERYGTGQYGEKLAYGDEPGITVAHRSGAVTIYRVNETGA